MVEGWSGTMSKAERTRTRNARQKIAAQQAAARRAETRRRFLIAGSSVAVVVALVATLVAVKLTSATPARPAASRPRWPTWSARSRPSRPRCSRGPAPGQAVTAPQPVRTPGPVLTVSGKPTIVFVSEESCPFCAAERWPLAVALSHFGTWSHLGTTRSSSTDVYPDTATLSFRTATYHSAQLTLRTTELADSAGRPLQPQTALDTQLIRAYDVPPYVNSASQSGSVPFLDIGNRDILAGAQYDPQVLAGLSAAQIAAQLRDPSTPVAKAIDGSARIIIAAINHLLHNRAARS